MYIIVKVPISKYNYVLLTAYILLDIDTVAYQKYCKANIMA